MNIAFVPARCGSQTIPFKNIKIICGRPLIYWALLALTKSKSIDQIYVATDCDDIKDVVVDFTFEKVQIFDRCDVNANNTASTESVMLEFLDGMNFSEEDLFILVQATTPFTSSDDFDNAINIIKSDSEIDSLLSCVESKRFFWTKDGIAINYNYLKRPLRQDFDGLLMENGAFYINTVENIYKYKNRLSGNIHPYVMPEYTAIEADEEDDWLIIEQLMYKYIINKQTRANSVKIFATDVDGVLTDAGMYYDNNGNELKRFNTHDGMAFNILKERGIITAMLTSEKTNIVKLRANKLQVDYLFQGVKGSEKLEALNKICVEKNMSLSEVAYIGDDINDYNVLSSVGFPACPKNAIANIKSIKGITHLSKSGGDGAVREFVELLLKE
jgi:N-acylneuraminate cytidylyltransferase